jgi:cell division septation protein DedD
MDNFDDFQQKGIKEKNMYVLHLDAPRIIILSSVLIGVIVVSFLIGMNFTKTSDKTDPIFGGKEAIQDFPLSDGNVDGKGISPLADEGLNPPSSDLPKENALNSNSDSKQSNNNALIIPSDKNGTSNDVINSEHVKEVVPSSNDIKHADSSYDEPKVIKPKAQQKSKNAKKQRVVEVVSREKSTKSSMTKGGYSIQVAAYDRKAKAIEEINSLKKMSYDAFFDKSQVNGKRYYRVKIGPIASKNKAIEMLNELQENSKYGESYLVKE